MDISKGRYWDKPWSLVDGCTPCSPGCERCWAAGIRHRFHYGDRFLEGKLTNEHGHFTGTIITRPERLYIPIERRKPTVYAIWNDLFHEKVPLDFQAEAYRVIRTAKQHIFLILTKRPYIMEYVRSMGSPLDNVYHGLTICNQPEADEKIPIFLQVPGKKFLSIEPMLGPVDLGISLLNFHIPDHFDRDLRKTKAHDSLGINAVILGGETGPGARPMHPDWVRSVRDQCAAAGVPFFFKGWGNKLPEFKDCIGVATPGPYEALTMNISRLLDGRTHDDLPWRCE